ncbi:MAG: DUF401 family protein [Thermodesulfovibrionales bacterium]
MTDIIRIVSVFVLILILLRKKWGVGYSLLSGTAFLMLLYFMTPYSVGITVYSAVTSAVTLKLLLALSFIRMFEIIMREKNVLKQIMDSFKGILRHKKSVIVSMPLLIGMLPSVGGAYFSAPMVDEATSDIDMTSDEKAFSNYWYRHPWEYILPLYPGIILASVLTKIDVRTFIVLNLAYAICMVVVGNFFGLQKAKGVFERSGNVSKKGLLSFIPIAILLLLVMVFRIELHYALMIITVLLIVFYRYGIKDIWRIVKHGLSGEVIFLILGVMLFKEALEHSGAVKNLSDYFTLMSIPLVALVFILPFATGVLTGITVGAVGSTFPLIVSMTGSDPYLLSLAFAAGFVGVLLSPVHVCLILTKEYFKADMWLIYKKIIPASMIVSVVAIIQYLVVN